MSIIIGFEVLFSCCILFVITQFYNNQNNI